MVFGSQLVQGNFDDDALLDAKNEEATREIDASVLLGHLRRRLVRCLEDFECQFIGLFIHTNEDG